MGLMTRPIGEVFSYNGTKLKVVERLSCDECYFANSEYCAKSLHMAGYCGAYYRDDYKKVCFVQVKDNEYTD